MEAPAPRVNTNLLHALVMDGLISQSQSEGAALFAKRRMVHVEEALLQMATLDEAVLLKFQATYYKTQFVSTQKLARAPISSSLLTLIPHKLAVKFTVFPVKYDARHGVLSILTVEPNDLDILKNVQFATRVPKVRALVARPAAIGAAIKVHYEDEVQAFGNIRATGPLMASGPSVTQSYEQPSLQPPAPPSAMYTEEPPLPPPVTSFDSGAFPPLPSAGSAQQPMQPAQHAQHPQAVQGAQSSMPYRPTPAPHAGMQPQVPAMPTPNQGIAGVHGAPGVHGGLAGGPPGAPQGLALGVHPATLAGAAAPTPPSSPGGYGAPPGLEGGNLLGQSGIPGISGMPGMPGLSELSGRAGLERQPSGIALHDYLETLNVLVALLENERGDLRNHSVSVARMCRRFCERLGLTAQDSDAIIVAAYLHDIGKSSAFHLTALNVAQYEQHRQQAKKSYLTPVRIFESVRLPDNVVPTLTHMYERYDGQGFPDRLTGKEISLGARVLAIVETYADLTGHASNPFRRKLSAQEAWDALAKFRGKVFDPNLVDVFKLVVLGDDLRAKLLADSRRALIVDPDAEETTILELRLAEHGYEVTIARNAADAINELANEFDVVISEVELTPFDGFSLLERARAAGNAVPFVFLSKHAESEVVQKGFDVGADEFISKPASPDVVALKVNRVLDGAGRKKKSGGVSGSLSEMGLPDVVQILFHGRKSGRLAIEAGGRRGEILFGEGHIFEASFGDALNEEAFYEMLMLGTGDFALDPNFVPTERKIELSPESMLLEGMRRLDEAER